MAKQGIKVRILGCGPSCGVPSLLGSWGECNPENPKNYRLRSSVLIQVNGKNFLIDSSPDLRVQFLRAGISDVEAVLYTHSHFDHIDGIAELRIVGLKNEKKIPVYTDEPTLETIMRRHDYLFQSTSPIYPAVFEGHVIEHGKPFTISSETFIPFEQEHGHIKSIGYRIGDFAYSTDLKRLPEKSFDYVRGLKLWIVECLAYKPHLTHAHLEYALELIEKFKPERALITHMNQMVDYDAVLPHLPSNVMPAYDGLEIKL